MPDDLDVVRAVRTHVPEMSDEAFTTGRTQLTAMLAPQEEGVTPLPRQRTEPPRRRTGQQPRRGRLLPAAAAAAVLISTGVAVTGVGGTPQDGAQDERPAVSRKVPEELEPPIRSLPPIPPFPANAADTLAPNASAPEQAPGQYLLVITEHAPSNVTRVWVPRDRSEDWFRIDLAGNQSLVAGGRFDDAAPAQGKSAWIHPTWRFLEQAPRDTRALYASLRNAASGAPDEVERVFEIATDLFARVIPTDLRAALLRALSYIPGVQFGMGETRDGRPANILRLYGHATRHELLFDPSSAQLIGTRVTRLPQGNAIQDDVIRYAVVDRMGQLPD